MPCRRAAAIAASTTSRRWCPTARRRCRRCAASARPACRRGGPSRRRPGRSWLAAVWPRSETPTAPRTPKPRSVKFSPLRTARPMPSYGTQRTNDGVHAALQDQVLEQPADLVVGERGDHRGAQAEAAPQAAGDVVLAAALPGPERAGGADPALARVEPQHDLAERDQVVAAVSPAGHGVSTVIAAAGRGDGLGGRASGDLGPVAGGEQVGGHHPGAADGEHRRQGEVAGAGWRR